ncbi:MAG: type II secretion system protein [Oscillospiraceae bacterium]
MNEKTKLRRPRKLKAFTLLEMIVVMAIIGVLSSIIIPSTVDQIRSSKIETANVQAEELYMAFQNYCTDMQIKGTELVRNKKTTEVPAFPGQYKKDKKHVGFIFTVKSKTDWEYLPVDCDLIKSEADPSKSSLTKEEESKCVYGLRKYLGETTLENLVGTSFYVQFDVDTYTVDFVLYCEQDNESTTVNEAFNYVLAVVNGGKLYTQVYGRPDTSVKDAKSQEYDTNQFLGGKATSENVVPYVGQYPIK